MAEHSGDTLMRVGSNVTIALTEGFRFHTDEGTITVVPAHGSGLHASRDDDAERRSVVTALRAARGWLGAPIERRRPASGVSGLPFRRVALLFTPHFKLGPVVESGEGRDAAGPHVDGIHADIIVNIQGSTVANPVNDLLAATVPAAPAPIRIPASNLGAVGSFDKALIRFTLGLPFRTGGAGSPGALLNGSPTALDLQPVADQLSVLLGDPPSKVPGQPTRKTQDF